MPSPFRSGPPQRPQPAPQQAKVHTTTGPISAVPCPWGCGHKNDFRPLAGAGLGGMGEGEIGMETGAVFGCDHCKRKFRILGLEQVTVVKVTPFAPKPRR